MARSQVERYFDTPDRSWLFITEEKGVGYHYEIHEGGDGRPLLPSIMKGARDPSRGIIIKPAARHAIEVFWRADGTLHSLILPESTSASVVMDPEVRPADLRKMTPYSTIGNEWIKVGLAALSIGVFMMSVAGVVNKSFSIVMNGYHEIAQTLPSTRILQLSGVTSTPIGQMPALSTLPALQWERLARYPLQPGQVISELVYENGTWDIRVALSKVAPQPIEHPEAPAADHATTAPAEPSASASSVAAISDINAQHEVSHWGGDQ